MAAYRVEIRPAVAKALRKMPRDAQAGIIGVLSNLGAEPRPIGVCAIRGHRPYLRLRIGDYRVIYSVDDRQRLVTVAVAGHRRDVYRGIPAQRSGDGSRVGMPDVPDPSWPLIVRQNWVNEGLRGIWAMDMEEDLRLAFFTMAVRLIEVRERGGYPAG